MTASLWSERDLPVLRAIAAAVASEADPNQALKAVELPPDSITRSLVRLHDAGYIEVRLLRGDGQIMGAHVLKALPAALREVGMWPSAATPLEEKRRRRSAFMQRLYDRTDGQPLRRINFADIGREFGWSETDTRPIVDYLSAESLLEFAGLGGSISITHTGVVEMEQLLTTPQESTRHFPPVSVVNVFGNVVASQIQSGTTGSHQTPLQERS